LGRTLVEPEVFDSLLSCFEACKKPPTDADSSVRMTSRRVVKAINGCAPYSCKKTIGVI